MPNKGAGLTQTNRATSRNARFADEDWVGLSMNRAELRRVARGGGRVVSSTLVLRSRVVMVATMPSVTGKSKSHERGIFAENPAKGDKRPVTGEICGVTQTTALLRGIWGLDHR